MTGLFLLDGVSIRCPVVPNLPAPYRAGQRDKAAGWPSYRENPRYRNSDRYSVMVFIWNCGIYRTSPTPIRVCLPYPGPRSRYFACGSYRYARAGATTTSPLRGSVDPTSPHNTYKALSTHVATVPPPNGHGDTKCPDSPTAT